MVYPFLLPYMFLSSPKQFEALFWDIFSGSLVHPTTASTRYKRLLTLESGNVEAPSGRRDLAGYMFLGVDSSEAMYQLKWKSLFMFHFQTVKVYIQFRAAFQKRQKNTEVIYLYLPSLKLAQAPENGWLARCFREGLSCHLPPRPRPPWHVEAWELEISRDQRGWAEISGRVIGRWYEKALLLMGSEIPNHLKMLQKPCDKMMG